MLFEVKKNSPFLEKGLQKYNSILNYQNFFFGKMKKAKLSSLFLCAL